jgi:hypothetical protein
MLALANDHGDHSFLMIDSNYANSGHINRLLVKRAFLNHPKEREGCHPFRGTAWCSRLGGTGRRCRHNNDHSCPPIWGGLDFESSADF